MSSNGVSAASDSLSDGTTTQAASIEEISSSITEISSQAAINSDNAGEAKTLANSASKSTTDGLRKMEETVVAMNAIFESSSAIQKIVKSIDDIAFQTNLLALNAAVEAARAGAHGKGFAVVADEVRNLAGRSAKAAQETAVLVEDTVNKIEGGNKYAQETSEELAKISDSVENVSALVSKIAVASEDQSSSIQEINSGLNQIDSIIQQNAAVAEETSSASSELLSQTSALRGVLRKYSGNSTTVATEDSINSDNMVSIGMN
jgi:methyl-accepting chemotaxis protein